MQTVLLEVFCGSGGLGTELVVSVQGQLTFVKRILWAGRYAREQVLQLVVSPVQPSLTYAVVSHRSFNFKDCES